VNCSPFTIRLFIACANCTLSLSFELNLTKVDGFPFGVFSLKFNSKVCKFSCVCNCVGDCNSSCSFLVIFLVAFYNIDIC
jgi:hypothetical protein